MFTEGEHFGLGLDSTVPLGFLHQGIEDRGRYVHTRLFISIYI